MSVSKMSIDELEQLSYKDITFLLLEENNKPINTANLFKKIIKLLKLDDSVFENKIADYYTSLATDKRFVLLDDGKWDLRSHHTSDKIKSNHVEDDSDLEDEEELQDEDEILDEENEDDYSDGDEDSGYDSTQEDLKDLVIIDDDDMEELEQ